MNSLGMPHRIAIASYYFVPEQTPRSFRAFDLAREFARRGNSVKVLIPDYEYDYRTMEHEFGFTIQVINTGFLFNKDAKRSAAAKTCSSPRSDRSPLRAILRIILRLIFLEGKLSEYAVPLFRALNKEEVEYDELISIGLPFSVHLGCFLALLFRPRLARKRIADYGDPFSAGPSFRGIRLVYRLLERIVLRSFDKVVVPNDGQARLFVNITKPWKISVIPQGIDLSMVKTSAYKPNSIPTFAYAGMFYPGLRDPRPLLDFLSRLPIPFRFVVYTDVDNELNMSLVSPYVDPLGEKLVIKRRIDRFELIYRLSEFDFLLNFANSVDYLKPSKLIDYTLAGRPIFEVGSRFDSEKSRLLSYLKGDFGDSAAVVHVPLLSNETVCKMFMEL